MAWVTEEEYQAAKQVRAYEYLQTYQPGRLKKTRTRNEWQLQDHDSLRSMRSPANGIGSPGISEECQPSGF